jgi:hypothetical protein
MEKLTRHIEDRLTTHKFCTIFESDLARIWPHTLSNDRRKEAIERFASEHGLSATIYDPGLRVVFKKSAKRKKPKSAK